jgi:hypothetical protein
MTRADAGRSGVVDRAAANWRAKSLDELRFRDRRAAVIEQLAATLVRRRMAAADVYEETSVEFLNGETTIRFDVLCAPPDTPWDGIECKVANDLDEQQGSELSWAAEQAAKLGEPLKVIIASASDKVSLIPIIRVNVRRSDLVCYVAADTFASLALPGPGERVSAA